MFQAVIKDRPFEDAIQNWRSDLDCRFHRSPIYPEVARNTDASCSGCQSLRVIRIVQADFGPYVPLMKMQRKRGTRSDVESSNQGIGLEPRLAS